MAEHRLFHYQQVLLDDRKHFQLGLAGGYGSGKTTFGIYWNFDRAKMNPDKVSWILAPGYDILRNVIMDKYVGFLVEQGFIEDIHYKVNYSASRLSIEFYFGHKVFFKSAGTKSLQGADISHLWVDEAGECDELATTNSLNRVGRKKGEFAQVLFTGTPQGLNHYYKRFEGLKNASGPFRWDDRRLILHFQTAWNTTLPEQYIKQRIDDFGHDENLIRAWLLGQFVPLFEHNCYRFNEQIHAAKEYDPDPDMPLVVGWDFNVGQVVWVTMQQWEGVCYMLGEAPRRCDTTDEACDAFLKAYPPQVWKNVEIMIDGDASGWHRDTRAYYCDYDIILNKLRSHYPFLRIIAPRSNESVQTRIVITNRCLAKGFLFLDRRLRYTIESFNSTTYNDNKDGIAKPSGTDTWTHASDAATYPLCRLYPLSLERFKRGVIR